MKEEKNEKEMKKESSKKKSSTTSRKTTTKKTTTPKKKVSTTSSKKTSTTKKATSSKKPEAQKSVEKEPIEKKVLEKVEVPKHIEIVEEKKEEKTEKKESLYQDQTIRMLSIVVVILAFVLAAVTYFKFFHEVENISYSDEWKGKSYLVSKNVVHQVSLGEILNVVNKSDTFIFVTTLDNEEEFELEKDLRKIVLDYHLESKFFVYPLEEATKNKALENLQVMDSVKVPTILFYRDGKLIDRVEREDAKMIEAADFVHLLDIFEYKK